MEVSEAYVVLAGSALPTEASQIRSAPVAAVTDGAVLAGIDQAERKHLLVPIGDADLAPGQTSQAVRVGERVLVVDGASRRFLDLECTIPRLDLVFERLAEDIIHRLSEAADDPVSVCRSTVEDWRALLRTASTAVDRETVLGLIGELEVLGRLAESTPESALRSWVGPDGATHDFSHNGEALEVKTTASVEGNEVAISNLDQLDPSHSDRLSLVVVHVRMDPTASTLDQRIDELVANGIPKEALLARVEKTGYVYESSPETPTTYEIRSVRCWIVGKTFPGLRATALGEDRLAGISDVRYRLWLDAAPPRLTDDEFAVVTDAWGR